MTNLLIFRFVLLNAAGLAGFFLAWHHGLVIEAWNADTTPISGTIIALFLITWGFIAYRVVEVSRLLNLLDTSPLRVMRYFTRSQTDANEILKVKLTSRSEPLMAVCGVLITLGLLGTVWGMKEALIGVDSTKVGDINNLASAVASLTSGFMVALYTTIVGVVFSVFLFFNAQLLKGGQSRLYTKLLERRG